MKTTKIVPRIYIGFDTDGIIQTIGPAIPENFEYFEIEYEKVENLLTLREDPMDYVVNYDIEFKKYVLVPIKQEDSLDIRLTPLTKYNSTFFAAKLIINTKNSSATLKVDNGVQTKLKLNEFKFYFTKKDNPNMFIKSLVFSSDVKVTDDVFSSIDDTTIYTSLSLDKIYYEVVN